MQGFMGWGYMRLCCHLMGSRSLILRPHTALSYFRCITYMHTGTIVYLIKNFFMFNYFIIDFLHSPFQLNPLISMLIIKILKDTHF